MTDHTAVSTSDSAGPTRDLEIELLALDLDRCTRCTGTLENIERAVAMVSRVLDATGTTVRVRTILIESEEQARSHRFETSPTIRIDGHDIVFETRESRCDSCTDVCGCGEGTDCRVWQYQGREHTEAPVGLVVEAILREIHGRPRPAPDGPGYGGVPENLKRFFAGRLGRRSESAAIEACCASAESEACCEPEAKESCCGDDKAVGAGTCGCR